MIAANQLDREAGREALTLMNQALLDLEAAGVSGLSGLADRELQALLTLL